MAAVNFFFNHEALPPENDMHKQREAFLATLTEYDLLYTRNKEIVGKGVISNDLPSKLELRGGLKLGEIIDSIPNKDQKTLAYSYFIIYPIDDHINWEAYLQLVGDAYFHIGEDKYEAFYGYMISMEGGIAFTHALYEDLKKDKLIIFGGKDEDKALLLNLWGNKDNTAFIQQKIDELKANQLNGWELLEAILGDDFIFETSFKRAFLGLRRGEQDAIIQGFQKAKERNLQTPFSPSGDLISPCTGKPKLPNVCELRIYDPVALRVYFREEYPRVYVASVYKKSTGRQTEEIKEAQRIVNRLRLTNP